MFTFGAFAMMQLEVFVYHLLFVLWLSIICASKRNGEILKTTVLSYSILLGDETICFVNWLLAT